MYGKREKGNLQRIRKRAKNYVENEVIVTTNKKARNDGLPHYLNVAAGVSSAATGFGDPSIDGVLARLGRGTKSVSRAFVPKSSTPALAGLNAGLSLSLNKISADYNDEEDDIGLSRTYRIAFEEEVNVLQICTELRSTKAVQNARPNHISEIMIRPDDEFYGVQWGLVAIDCEAGWDIEQGDLSVVIAIVDSGADLMHEDLSSKLLQGYDFVDFQGSGGGRYTLLGDYGSRDDQPADEDGHGSHCAGIAASDSNNGTGVAGVCWRGKILPVRVMFRVFDNFEQRETSVGTDIDIDAGIKFAIDSGAHVINLSLGGEQPSHEQILDYAFDQGVCVLAATGNENSNAASYPASNPKTLAVGAIDQSLNRASFSNYGPAYNRFVMSPGVHIGSTYKDNGYIYLDGTSMATPHVTGLAALIVSLALRSGRKFSASDVYEIIRSTAKPLGSGKGDPFFGEGLINVEAALQAAKEKLA